MQNMQLSSIPPLDSFPPLIQELLTEAATAFNKIPLEVPIVALLSLLAAGVGHSRVLVIKEGWEESGNLYLSIVARSGLGKSPCFRAFHQPLWDFDLERKATFDQSMNEYNQGQGEKPTLTQYVVEDTTTEALGKIMADNPRGILWACDELSSLLLNLDRYSKSKGGTKSKIISAYDGHSWKTSRQASEKEQVNPAAVLSIVGTVQPKILPNLFNPTDIFSGLLPRFIFIRADRQAPALMSDEAFTGQPLLRQITASLLALEMHMEGDQPKPGRVHLTDEAYGAFHQWHDQKMNEAWHGSEMDQSICAKLMGQTARIALLLHCLKATLNDTDSLTPLEESTMLEALNIGNWIQAHQKQIWLSMGIVDEPTLSPLERAIMETALEIDSTEVVLNQDFNTQIINRLGHDVDPSFLGREANRLGLKSCTIGKCRGKQISSKVATQFREKLYS